MELFNLSQEVSLVNPLLAELRDVDIQGDPLRFRRNIERLGELFAWEIGRRMPSVERAVTTPLGTATVPVLREQPVLATILRAGLPLHQGLLNIFDRADNAFISAFRKHEGDEASFEVEIEYLAAPSLDDRIVVLCDPMLATGSSMVLAYQALLARGTPAHTHVATVIASRAGVECIQRELPDNCTLWVAAVDEELNDRAYIVPGLGDAGDLCYGDKV